MRHAQMGTRCSSSTTAPTAYARSRSCWATWTARRSPTFRTRATSTSPR
jgi:hypothetical protein